jgi:hypothetical protein
VPCDQQLIKKSTIPHEKKGVIEEGAESANMSAQIQADDNSGGHGGTPPSIVVKTHLRNVCVSGKVPVIGQQLHQKHDT